MPATEYPHGVCRIDISRSASGSKPAERRDYEGQPLGFRPAVPASVTQIGGKFVVVRHPN